MAGRSPFTTRSKEKGVIAFRKKAIMSAKESPNIDRRIK